MPEIGKRINNQTVRDDLSAAKSAISSHIARLAHVHTHAVQFLTTLNACATPEARRSLINRTDSETITAAISKLERIIKVDSKKRAKRVPKGARLKRS